MFNISKIQIESNSQLPVSFYCSWVSCVQYFKDTNREQFTTVWKIHAPGIELCSIFQRYKSRAIHNPCILALISAGAVFNISKIQIESNSQPCPRCWVSRYCCVQYFKDTNREQFTTRWFNRKHQHLLCSIFQRYKSRAIHNILPAEPLTEPAVFNISKIQIESNSQLNVYKSFFRCSCVQYFKDTNREQFTTRRNYIIIHR